MLENRQTARRILTTALGAILVATLVGIWLDWRAHESTHVQIVLEREQNRELHEKMVEFMELGNRFASSKDYPDINNVGALLTHIGAEGQRTYVQKVVDQEVVLEKIENNGKAIRQNAKKLDDIEKLLREK